MSKQCVEKVNYYKSNRFVILFLVFITACTTTPNIEELSESLRSTSELATSEFVISKLISVKRSQEVFGIKVSPDAVFMAEVEATVKIGVNLESFTHENIVFSGDTIIISLPKLEILHFSMPPDKIKPLDDLSREYFFNKFSPEEKDNFYRGAETEMRNSVLAYKFFRTSKLHTIAFFKLFLKQLGYMQVRIVLPEQEEIESN